MICVVVVISENIFYIQLYLIVEHYVFETSHAFGSTEITWCLLMHICAIWCGRRSLKQWLFVRSEPSHCDTYMRQIIRPSFAHTITCSMVEGKPLRKPMMTWFQMEPETKNYLQFKWKCNNLITRNAFIDAICRMMAAMLLLRYVQG